MVQRTWHIVLPRGLIYCTERTQSKIGKEEMCMQEAQRKPGPACRSLSGWSQAEHTSFLQHWIGTTGVRRCSPGKLIRDLMPKVLLGAGASLVAQRLKRLPLMQETWVLSLVLGRSPGRKWSTHSSMLAWRIPWSEEPGGLQSTGSQRVGHDWATSLSRKNLPPNTYQNSRLPEGKRVLSIHHIVCARVQ